MAITKVTTDVIVDDAITSPKVADDLALSGNPTAATQSAGNNSTRVATTAFVTTALSALSSNSISDADSDTKIQVEESSDEDKIRFDIAGTEEMVLDATGIVINDGSNDRDFRIESNGNANMLFVDGGNDRVGIGTASPQKNLEIKDGTLPVLRLNCGRNEGVGSDYALGDIEFFSSDSSGTGTRVLTSINAIADAASAAPGGHLTFKTAPTNSTTVERMRIDNLGKVGIGTDNPTVPLDVYNGSGWGGLDLDGTSGAELRMQKAGTTYGQIYASDGHGFVINATNGLADILFQSGGSTKMIVDGSKVGIGTDSPDSLLHLKSGNRDLKFILADSPSSGNVGAQIRGGSGEYIGIAADGTGIGLVVDDSNNVGIGTTDFNNMSSSSYKGLKVGGAVLQDSGGGNGSATWLGNNAYVGSGNNFYFDAGGTASGIQLTSGDINFYTFDGGGGSADAQWSPAARMHIKENGNVGIGTTSMVSNARLTVDGGDMMVQASNNNCGISDLLPGYTRGDYGVVHSSANHIYFSVGSSYISYINGSNGTFNVSDQRLKENVATLTGTLDKVKQLRGVSFTWKDTEERGTDTAIGLIAQEVEAVYPELVDDGGLPKDNDGNDPLKSVNYAHLTSVLIEAIKELEARVKELEK